MFGLRLRVTAGPLHSRQKYVTCSLNETYLLVGFSLFGLKPECLARRAIYKHHQMASSPREDTRVVTRAVRAGV